MKRLIGTGALCAVAGLIAGKVALKVGLFKLVLVSILAAKKFTIAGAIALAAVLRWIFRKPTEDAANA
jgi:uncharacterized membrane-anchored protein